MDKFTLFWLTGKAEVIKGNDIANACNRNGIGQGALAALDFYAQGDIKNDYTWNPTTRSWDTSIAKIDSK